MKKLVVFDLFLIFVVSIASALIVHEIRADGVPLIPSCLEKPCYRTSELTAFLKRRDQSSHLFFDARPHDIYQDDHPPRALNLPATQLDFFYDFYLGNAGPDTPIFIYGSTVSRPFDRELAQSLALKGHKNITVLF